VRPQSATVPSEDIAAHQLDVELRGLVRPPSPIDRHGELDGECTYIFRPEHMVLHNAPGIGRSGVFSSGSMVTLVSSSLSSAESASTIFGAPSKSGSQPLRKRRPPCRESSLRTPSSSASLCPGPRGRRCTRDNSSARVRAAAARSHRGR
jgi:hypothetical protein